MKIYFEDKPPMTNTELLAKYRFEVTRKFIFPLTWEQQLDNDLIIMSLETEILKRMKEQENVL